MFSSYSLLKLVPHFANLVSQPGLFSPFLLLLLYLWLSFLAYVACAPHKTHYSGVLALGTICHKKTVKHFHYCCLVSLCGHFVEPQENKYLITFQLLGHHKRWLSASYTYITVWEVLPCGGIPSHSENPCMKKTRVGAITWLHLTWT